MKIIDTHAHLVSDKLYENIDEIIQRAKANHVVKILCICTSIEEFEKAEKLQQQYDFIDLAYGVHPADLHIREEKDFEFIEYLLQNKKIVAVGEIGLDYHWNVVDKQIQQNQFIRQIELANKYNVPVLIHMREATKDCVDIILKHAKIKGIMHCFSGSFETANQLIVHGFYIAFGGILTFKNANQLLEVAKKLPSNRIFVETDAPYLAPVPYRGKVNEVSYIKSTFEFLEQLRQESLSEVMLQNYQDLFHGNN